MFFVLGAAVIFFLGLVLNYLLFGDDHYHPDSDYNN